MTNLPETNLSNSGGKIVTRYSSARFTKRNCELLFQEAASKGVANISCVLLDSLELVNLKSLFSFDEDEARDIVLDRTIRVAAMLRSVRGPDRTIVSLSSTIGTLASYSSRLEAVLKSYEANSHLARLIQNQTFKHLHPLLKRLGVNNSRSNVVRDLARYLIEETALRLAAADARRWTYELSLTEETPEVEAAVAEVVPNVDRSNWIPMIYTQPVQSSGVEVEGLTFSYPKQAEMAVAHCSIKCGPGEIVGILGRSGSGKSTLLKLIAGHLRPLDGSIRISDAEVTELPPRDRNVATVFQDFALFPHLTVRQNVAFGIEADKRFTAEEVSLLVQILLRRFGLAELADRHPQELSGGQRQRTAIARALAFGPSLFLLDEPTASLDFDAKDELAGILWHVASLPPAPTVILVSHDREFVLDVASTLAVMDAGRIIVNGPALKIARAPDNALVASVVGSHLLIPLETEGSHVSSDRQVSGSDAEATLAIVREDGIVFRRAGKAQGPGRAEQLTVKGKVTAKVSTARGVRLVVKINRRTVHWRERECGRTTEQIEPGDEVEISFGRAEANIGRIGG
ncbi:MAG: ABC transporter ATP-binding protein [Acidobacteria bacterium]|nr:ABC transporter ATP-binding protein [Acidobacteriota bacterium]